MKCLIIALLLPACATTPLDKKRKDVMSCMKELKAEDSDTMDAFEVCRQLYSLRKIDEGKDIQDGK